MKIRYYVILYTILMLAVLLGIGHTYQTLGYSGRDMVSYNEQKRLAEEELQSGTPIANIEQEYDCDILLRTDAEYEALLNEWMKNGAIIFDYFVDGQLTGKIIWNDKEQSYKTMQSTLFHKMLLIWAFILAAGYLLLFMIFLSFIRPFDELQQFAAQIAKGNLDFPLPVRKHNFFGAFTESFDLMREELSRARESEYQANRSKKELVADLSHDIKTPVAAIKATCEVMQMKESNPDTLDKVSVIAAKADTIDHLIGNLFHATMDELEALKVEVTEESTLCIEKMLADLRYYGELIVPETIPECLVYMDRLRLEQVIDNIVNNAYKYAKTSVTIHFYNLSDGIKIRIQDNGAGVPEEELPLVTEKFYRGSNTKGKDGSGLGLYLAKMFMEQMQGGLECYNENGFVVELYLKKV